jgi:5-methylcytosine-specific restriction endonuclease McrA
VLDELILRDGARCVWCGRQPWREDLTVEHLLPRTRRGRGTPDNLAVACRACNRRRGATPVAAYVRAEREAGRPPRVDLVRDALARLAQSATPEHAAYGDRQLELLERIG